MTTVGWTATTSVIPVSRNGYCPHVYRGSGHAEATAPIPRIPPPHWARLAYYRSLRHPGEDVRPGGRSKPCCSRLPGASRGEIPGGPDRVREAELGDGPDAIPGLGRRV